MEEQAAHEALRLVQLPLCGHGTSASFLKGLLVVGEEGGEDRNFPLFTTD